MRAALCTAFVGTNYCGWQSQKNGLSVQEVLCDAAQSIYGQKVNITGCSRTDAKVHAKNFVCHADFPFYIPEDAIPKAFNRVLPPDIAVKAAKYVPEDFHARYSSKGKTYVYRIYTDSAKNPFYENRVLHLPKIINLERIKSAAAGFEGTNDLSSLMSAGSSVADRVRTIYGCEVFEKDGTVNLAVTADGFLYNTVRIITGTLFFDEEITFEKVKNIIAAKNRAAAGPTAPPHGLYLERVYYKSPIPEKGMTDFGSFFDI